MPLLKVETISKSPFGDINDRQHKFTIKVGTGLRGEKGDRGDRGLQGARGLQGIQGIQGVKGDKGDRGDTGLINGATQVQVHPTTKVMFDGSTIPATAAASREVGVSNGQLPLAQDLTKALYTPLQLAGTLTSDTDNINTKNEGYVYYINNRPQGASELGFGVFWTELHHGSAQRLQYFKSVESVYRHYVRRETARNSQTYDDWIKYAFHGEDYTATSVKSGAASYKRGWRKIVATFGTGDSTIYVNKGTRELTLTQVRVKLLNSNTVIHPSDNRAPFSYQVIENSNQQRVEIKKLASATWLDGAEIHVFIDEVL